MSGLLDLPTELRLRIYELAVAEPWPVSIITYSGAHDLKPRRLLTAEALRLVDKRLKGDILPLYWSGNAFGLFMAVGESRVGKRSDDETDRIFRRWLEDTVKANVHLIRHLEFTVTGHCEQKRQALEHPKEPGVWYRVDAPYCTTVVYVDLWESPENAVIVDGEVCGHGDEMKARFHEVLSAMPRSSRQPQVTRGVLWQLFESCRVL